MSSKDYIQQEINWLKAVHVRENNQASEDHLNANRQKFTGQDAIVYSLLQQGAKLTSYNAMTQWHIGHLPRRIKDLKDEAGVQIDWEWCMDDTGKKTNYKIWFLPEHRKMFFEKGWIKNEFKKEAK